MAIPFFDTGLESIISYLKSSLRNMNTSYGWRWFYDAPSIFWYANKLFTCEHDSVLFLLCKMLPLESWVSTCRVFLRKSIPTYEEICTWSLFVALASSLNLTYCSWFYCTFMRYSFLIGTVFVISMVFGLHVATDAFIHLNFYLTFSHVVAFMKLYLSYFCLMYFAYLNLQ